MKQVFYSYSSNLKKLPKGLLIFIILLLLVLIPLILSLALIGTAFAITAAVITKLLPLKKKQIRTVEKNEPMIIDITPEEEKRNKV